MFSETLNGFLEIFSNPNKLNSTTTILFMILIPVVVIVLRVVHFFTVKRRPCKVFLVDFTCYKPPATQMCSHEVLIERMRSTRKGISEESIDFMKAFVEKMGLGSSTYVTEAFLRDPASGCMEDSRREVENTMFGSIDTLLAKTRVKSQEIGIVVTNCCLFNAVPSLSGMIVNRYKLRHDVITYNLSGMGCAAGLVAVGLTKNLLQVHHNSYALVVSTESLSEHAYIGNDRSKLLVNCGFRLGGAAILLSNHPSDHRKSKYRLLHAVHTHTASSDRSYKCIMREEDNDGIAGVTVNKDLLFSATDAIESNLSSLGHLILPLSEKLLFISNHIARKLFGSILTIRPYIPGFNKVVDHFLSHVGGKPVLDALQTKLRLSEAHMEPSRMMLYRFGNTSSSSIWYSLAYVEAKGRIKEGDRVWQLAFGSGFKCCSVVWRAIRSVSCDESNPWCHEIDEFPVEWKKKDALESLPYTFTPSK